MGKAISTTGQNLHKLAIVAGLTFAYLIVAIVAGIIAHSLALLASALHMFTDVLGLGLTLFAAWMALRPTTPQKTFGYYRLEILATLANSLILLLSTIYVLYEAYQRLHQPAAIAGGAMVGVAVVGVVVNLAGVLMLHHGAAESLSLQGAFLETVSDALGSVGVLVAALVILRTGYYPADPIISIVISLFIFPRTAQLMGRAVNVLLQGAPEHIDVVEIDRMFRETDGVEDVHDLHVWTLTSGIEVLSAHLVVAESIDSDGTQRLLEEINARLTRDFGISHVTVQAEHHDMTEREPPY